MANLFSINDGNISDAGVLGSANINHLTTNYSSIVPLWSNVRFSEKIYGENTNVVGIALNTYNISSYNNDDVLLIDINKSNGDTFSETFPLSSFTTNTIGIQNKTWNFIKFNSPFYLASNENFTFNIKIPNVNNIVNFYGTIALIDLAEQNVNSYQVYTATNSTDNPFETTIQSSSLQFNGSNSQYIEYANANNTAFNFPVNGDFTIEAWVKPLTASGGTWGTVVAYKNDLGTNTQQNGWALMINHGNGTIAWVRFQNWQVGGNVNSYYYDTSTQNVKHDQWNYIAASRSNGVFRFYVNGVQTTMRLSNGTIFDGNNTDFFGNNSIPCYLKIGSCDISSETNQNGFDYTGKIYEVRITNGIGRYTQATMPVPIEPLTVDNANVTYLGRLCNRYNKQIITDNAPSLLNITSVNSNLSSNMPLLSAEDPFNDLNKNSLYTDGVARVLGINDPTGKDFTLSANDFTLDFWAKPTVNSGALQTMFSHSYPYNNHGLWFGQATITDSMGVSFGVGTWDIFRVDKLAKNTALSALSASLANNWSQFTVNRKHGFVTIYRNGQVFDNFPATTVLTNANSAVYIGGRFTSSQMYNGLLYNVHLVNGTALYPVDITPPVSALSANSDTLLMMHTQDVSGNRVDDTSQNNLFFYNNRGTLTALNPFNDPTKNSLAYDGLTNRLKLAPSTTNDFVLSSSDFTIDLWVYPRSLAVDYSGIINSSTPTDNHGFYISNRTTAANTLEFGAGDGAWIVGTVSAYNTLNPYLSTPLLTTWSQLTLSRKRNIFSLYRNGQIIGSINSAKVLTNPNTNITIARTPSNAQFGNLLISNVRLVKGTNLYEIDYTVPTSPISATPETTLLLRSSATSAADVSNYGSIIYNNRGTLTANNPFNDSNERSLYYDGLSNKLRVLTAGNAFNLSANNFTIELFVYPLSSKNSCFLTTADRNDTTTGDYQGVFIGQASDTQFQWAVGNGAWPANLNRTLSAPSLSGKWNHITLNRANSTFYATINGAVTDVWNISGAQLTLTNTNSSISIGGRNINGHFSKTYISNVNFINGTAKYPLTSFSTPSVALSTVFGTVCLVNGTGVLNGTNGGFIDSSSSVYTISGFGSVSQANFSPYTSTGGNGIFGGVNDYLVIQTPDNGLDFGLNSFTVELWVNPTIGYNSTSRHYIDTRTTASSSSWAFGTGLGTGGFNRISWLKNNIASINLDYSLSAGWNHLVYSRDANVGGSSIGALFVNGVKRTSAFDTTNYNFGSLSATIGTRYNKVSGFFDGFMSDIRIVNGSVVYDITQDTLTVPTAPLTNIANTKLLLNFTNASISDLSYNNGFITYNGATTKNTTYKYNPGSLYFDSTSNLVSNTTRNLNLSTSDFTIEGWFYSVSSSPTTNRTLFTVGNSHNDGVMLRMDGLYVANSATAITTSEWISGAGYTGVFPISTWKHIAVTRKNGYVSTWVDGKRTTTTYVPRDLGGSKKLTIGGASHTLTANFFGYIDDFRIEKGVCLYDTNFTVPSSQIDPHADTKFILNNSNYEAYTNMLSLCSPFGYGNSESFYMNGSTGITDALYTVTSANNLGVNNFSMEFWVYPLNMATTGYWLRTDSRDNNGIFIGYTSSTTLIWNVLYGSARTQRSVTVSNVLTAWNHFVITRNNNVYTLYRNGSAIDADYTTSSPTNATNSIYIGSNPLGTTYGATSAYISNVRVISGTNIFSSNFTPATAEFDNVPNTKLLLNESSYDRYTRVDSLCSPFGYGVSDSVLLSGEDGLYTTVNSSSLTGTNFTVEFWAYMLASTSGPFVATNSPTNNYGFYIGATNNTTLAWKIGNGTYFINKTATVLSMLSTWNHISLVKNGYAYTLYLNGSAIDGDYSATTPTFNNNRINIGYDTTHTYTNAYISNVRVLSGVALYNSNFSPATADFTPVENTKLLLNSDNQNSYLSMSSLSSPYVGGAGSTYFSGTQFISAYHPTNFDFSTNDFTIEFWVYPTEKQAVLGVDSSWFNNVTPTNGSGIFIGYGTNTAFYLALGPSFGIVNTRINTVAGTTLTNKWTHVCLTRSGSIFTLYQNGSSVWTITDARTIPNLNNAVTWGGRFSDKAFTSFYLSNARILNGTCLYSSNFTPTDITSQNLFADVVLNYTTNYANNVYTYTNTKLGDIQIGGIITNSGTKTTTLTADSLILKNVTINTNGILTFPLTSSKTLTINGNNGLLVAEGGVLNIGTKNNPIPSNITHNLIFGNNNGLTATNNGIINVYGSYKLPYTTTTNNILCASNTFTVVDDVSTTWLSGDKVAIVHPSLSTTTYDLLTLSAFNDNKTFKTFTNTTVAHSALSSVNLSYIQNIPNFVNFTRNVNIKGGSNTVRGYVKILDTAKANINNAAFQNFGINSTGLKGVTIATNTSGYAILSSNVFYGDYANTTSHILNSTTSPIIYNLSAISNAFIGGYSSIDLNSVTLSSINITNNLILSSINDGISLINLSGSTVVDNNYIYKSGRHGLFLQQSNQINYPLININNLYSIGNINNGLNLLSSYLYDSNNNINLIYNNDGMAGTLITGTYKGINSLYNKNRGISATFGSVSSSVLSNINTSYNLIDGLYINAANGNTIYSNIINLTAIANQTNGFRLSGTSNNLLSATTLNLSSSLLSANSGAGLEAYSIIGSIQNISSFDNKIKISIGNGSTIIDGLCSLYSNNVNNSTDTHNLHILSGLNYGQTYFKNFTIKRSVTGVGYPIALDSVNFKQFFLENSDLSGNNGDIAFLNTRDRVTGSYIFNNSKFSSTPLPLGLGAYQPDVTRATGLAFTNYNKIKGNHITYLPAGTRTIDTVLYDTNSSDQISERLIPSSSTKKLKSGSKFVGVDSGQYTTVGVLVSKSANYNGSNPRLILKRNAGNGINDDTVLATLSSTATPGTFYPISGNSPVMFQYAALEFYVDCDGTNGYINIDSWYAF